MFVSLDINTDEVGEGLLEGSQIWILPLSKKE